VLDRNPWVAMSLMKAFEEAKRRSVKRAMDITASAYPILWCYEYARNDKALFGQDYWPYGIEGNRTTLDAFLQYGFEQGVCHRRLQVEELFAKQVQRQFRV